MKLDAVIGSVLLATLIACSGSDDKAADAQQPAAATTPASSSDSTTPTDGADTTAPPPADPAPTTDPATTTDPAATTPAVETCETLAAKAATPAGKLQLTAAHSFFGIEPVDVYATENDEGLTIALTETANECAYRANNLKAERLDEMTMLFRRKNGAEFAPGTFNVSEIGAESGQACQPDDQPFGTGTATAGGSARGKLTITAKTATQVDGTIDITDWQGRKTTFTFSAPICAPAAQQQDVTCCASADDQ